ncbi:MAG: restriction endonuclease subunit S, partial [Coriobacteriaceae bacterium]|nr:restriction endonuclease subunit S [Coriobacteriaceae bacterium]
PHGQVQITDGTGGSAQQHFNVGTCKKMQFMLPPIALQQEFSAFVQQVDKLKFETQQAIDKLQMLYDSLAQEYFAS